MIHSILYRLLPRTGHKQTKHSSKETQANLESNWERMR